MYTVVDSVYKKATRDHLFRMVTEYCKKNIKSKWNILTLCNTSFHLEERLVNHYTGRWSKCNVYCYEKDHKVIHHLLKVHEIDNNAPIHLVTDDVFNHPNNKWGDKSYSFVWLDFCNSYTDEFITKLVGLVQAIKWDRKAVLTITLNRARGRSNDNLKYGKFYKNYKDEGFAQHIINFLPPVVRVNRMQYLCKDIIRTGSPMNVFTFFIDKSRKK